MLYVVNKKHYLLTKLFIAIAHIFNYTRFPQLGVSIINLYLTTTHSLIQFFSTSSFACEKKSEEFDSIFSAWFYSKKARTRRKETSASAAAPSMSVWVLVYERYGWRRKQYNFENGKKFSGGVDSRCGSEMALQSTESSEIPVRWLHFFFSSLSMLCVVKMQW